MHIGVAWLNKLLDRAVTADEAEHALTHMGFPIESREPVPATPGTAGAPADVMLDVEVTSNRGDVLCHVGCAREIAAATGRALKAPSFALPGAGKEKASALTGVENRVPEECPLFTARLIRGVKVGPSPAWMVSALASVGQKSVNNVVDASNYALFEIGQPSHAFDFNTLRGKRIVVRRANEGEKLTALDGKTYALKADEVVVADAERAVGVAGVIGGVETSVTAKTTDILLEVATWAPSAVRRAARRLGLRTDASHRYERLVPAATVAGAADRIAALILEVAGGELLDGLIAAPAEVPAKLAAARTVVDLRPSRCDALLGIQVGTARMGALLGSLGVEPAPASHGGQPVLRCAIPPHRPDLAREVDLIEEVARSNGFDAIHVAPRVTSEVKRPQESERGMRALADVLTGLGYFETVTFSFVTREDAKAWMPAGLSALSVDENRRPGEPALRPSVIPSLLRCVRVNRHAGNKPAGGLRLFETASVFAEAPAASGQGKTVENTNLALVLEQARGEGQEALRAMRGAIEAAARAMGGAAAVVGVTAMEPIMPALAAGSCGGVTIGGNRAGYLALVSEETLRAHDLEGPIAVAEIGVQALLGMFPPRSVVEALPEFPGTERDLSVVVSDGVAWGAIEGIVAKVRPERCTRVEFVGVYRGKQVGAGKKSVTLRLTFRDAARTLRSEEVEPEVARLVAALKGEVGAELRA